MKNLFDIEIAFQDLKSRLNKTATAKFKLISIAGFLNQLFKEEANDKFISYFEDLVTVFLQLVINNEFGILPPDETDSFFKINENLKHLKGLGINQEEFIRADLILSENKRRALTILGEDFYSFPDLFDHSYSDNSVYIVLIETHDHKFHNSFDTGTIHRLNLSSSMRSKSENTDKVEFKNLIDLNDTEIVEYLNHVSDTAKTECQKLGIQNRYYTFTFYFDEKEFIYTGSSLGIGAIALAYNSVLIHNLYQHFYRFNGNSVFTAEVDCNGNLLKLDSNVLRMKLKEVFYSPFKNFVIPEDNITEAKEYLGILNQKYPKRELNLVPVRNYESLFRNLDIVEKVKLTAAAKAKKYFELYKTRIIVSLVFLIIILAGFITRQFLLPALDKNPVRFGFFGNSYVLFNKYGNEIWKSEPLTDIDKSYFEGYKDDQIRCQFTDLNNDGINELYYLSRNDSNLETSNTIFCSDKNVIGFPCKFPLLKLDYPNDSLENYSMRITGIKTIDYNKDGLNEILYWRTHINYYPSVLGIIDNNGKQISQFWNEGTPLTMKIFDIEDDGSQEILWGGCNNRNDSIECGALIIFDPKFISGSSPYTDPIGDHKKGLEKYYILFPKSVVLETTGKERNDVHSIQKKSSKTVTAFTYEYKANAGDIGSLIYDFDSQMNLINIGEDDFFKNKYNRMKDSVRAIGKIFPELDDYKKEIAKKLRWWDGEKFVYERAINKNYIDAKK